MISNDFEDNEDYIEDEFSRATKFLPSVLTTLDTKSKLQFYGYFKQATVGLCNIPKPGYFNFEAKSKWEAWERLKSLDSVEAKKAYVELLYDIHPTWSKQNIRGAVFVSRPIFDEEITKDEDKTIFDHIKEHNIDRVKALVNKDGSVMRVPDDEGMYPLHWACDRGFSDMVQFLLDVGTDVNQLDESGQSALIYAAAGNNVQSVEELLKHEPDTGIVDEDGLTALQLTTDDQIRAMLMRTQ